MTDKPPDWREPVKPLTRAAIERLAAKLRGNGLAPGTSAYAPVRSTACARDGSPCRGCSELYGRPVEHVPG